MAKEVRDQLQGPGAGLRTQEWREAEPSDGDLPEPAALLEPTEQEALSRLGRYVPRSVLPTDREGLRDAAIAMHAPDDVLATLDRVDPSRTFGTVAEVWADLGHPLDRRT